MQSKKLGIIREKLKPPNENRSVVLANHCNYTTFGALSEWGAPFFEKVRQQLFNLAHHDVVTFIGSGLYP